MRLGITARRVIVVALTFCLGALLGWHQPAFARPRRGKAKPTESVPTSCHADADCTLVVEGCCGCNEGGKQRAMVTKAKVAYEKKRKAMCRQTACPQLMSEDASCVAGHAVCKDGACTLGL